MILLQQLAVIPVNAMILRSLPIQKINIRMTRSKLKSYITDCYRSMLTKHKH